MAREAHGAHDAKAGPEDHGSARGEREGGPAVRREAVEQREGASPPRCSDDEGAFGSACCSVSNVMAVRPPIEAVHAGGASGPPSPGFAGGGSLCRSAAVVFVLWPFSPLGRGWYGSGPSGGESDSQRGGRGSWSLTLAVKSRGPCRSRYSALGRPRPGWRGPTWGSRVQALCRFGAGCPALSVLLRLPGLEKGWYRGDDAAGDLSSHSATTWLDAGLMRSGAWSEDRSGDGSSIPAPGPCIVFEAAWRGCSPSRDRVLIEGACRPPRAAPFVLSTFPFSTKGWKLFARSRPPQRL